MLAEFRVENYKSFKDEQVLSLITSSDESKGKNSIEIGGKSILKTAVVYGANASGKSNLIKAIACMNGIICNSAGYKPKAKLPVVPFLFDEKTKSAPTKFEATFFMEGIRYQYGFSATKEQVHGEWLLAWPLGREQTWFERDCNEHEPYFGPSLKGQNKSTWSKVKNNSLFLSVAAQWNHKQLSKVYDWFEKQLRELPNTREAIAITDSILLKDKNSDKTFGFHDLAIEALRKADFGVDDLEIEKVNPEDIEFPDDMPIEAQREFAKQLSEYPLCRKTLYHCNRKYSLNFEEESEGTKRFYSLLGPLLESTAFGYTLYKDELELNMHPLLTREIVITIRENEPNNISAQLIFTTHDTTLLDPELFGRDQVWFTEKDEFGATQLYSLADYKESAVRKGEAMQKRYLAGRYGAVPILERFDLVGTKKQ
jgi:hypothetical protein